MMEAFQLMVLVASAAAIVLACTSYFRVNRVLEQLRHDGNLWFYRPETQDIDEESAPPESPARGRL